MTEFRIETDTLGVVKVPADKLWGAQTQRSLEHFSIRQGLDSAGNDYRLRNVENGAARANHKGGAAGRFGSPANRASVRRDPGRPDRRREKGKLTKQISDGPMKGWLNFRASNGSEVVQRCKT
jgi:hypothetical protein